MLEMAKTTIFHPDDLRELAEKVGVRLSKTIDVGELGGSGDQLKLGESLEIYLLDGSCALRTKSVVSCSRTTRRWHFLISYSEIPFGYSAAFRTDNKWHVAETGQSDFASQLHNSLTWIDEHDNSEDEAVLLIAPDFRSTFIWIKSVPALFYAVHSADDTFAQRRFYNEQEILRKIESFDRYGMGISFLE